MSDIKITCRRVAAPFGEIKTYRLVNAGGAAVELSNLGAGMLAVEVPDKEGHIANVALGYADPADYMADGPCMGKIPGRYANRIAGGHLTVDGKEYRLPINNGPNHLHGGPEGFQNRLWEAEELPDGVRFSLRSADGDCNYPGNVTVTAEYRWSDDNTLSLRLYAETDAPTVINLTNHTYWNLDGADSGTVLDHRLRLKARRWLPTDETLIPTGEEAPVAGTPMDFTDFKTLGRDIEADIPALKYGKGYDNCWVLDEWEPGKTVEEAVELAAAKSGRKLTVDTDQPGVQVYTGNWLEGCPASRGGRRYRDYDGVAIEMQGFPDAPNRGGFPSQLLLPGAPYLRHIRFRFTTI